MGNKSFFVRTRRYAKFAWRYLGERLRGLDFSMVYVGDIQRNTTEFHGYSMTDSDTMRRLLMSLPVDPTKSSFLDIGCGKGMCLKVAKDLGYQKAAGIDLDSDLLKIARKNMDKLKLNVDLFEANAMEFEHYGDYDVYYMYNPFRPPIIDTVIEKIAFSQLSNPRDVWVVYLQPKYADMLDCLGFTVYKTLHDPTRDLDANIYYRPGTTSK